MPYPKVITAIVLCLFCGAIMLTFTTDCFALNQDYMEKKGIEGLFSGKGKADPRSPDRWQVWLGILAFPTAFAVWKWL